MTITPAVATIHGLDPIEHPDREVPEQEITERAVTAEQTSRPAKDTGPGEPTYSGVSRDDSNRG